MRKRKPFYGGMGTVSCATMREEDLIPSFVAEAKSLRLTREERRQVTEIANASRKRGYYESDDA